MQAWNDFVAETEKEFGTATTDTWLRSLKVIQSDAGNLYLQAADTFQAMWFDEHIKPKLKRGLLLPTGKRLRVHISVPSEKTQSEPSTSVSVEPEKVAFNSDPIESHAHLSQFVSGDTNALPYKLFCELAGFDVEQGVFHTPALQLGELNPIYLSGTPGTGKTHLVMALANALRNRGKKVYYITAESFTEHVIAAYRMGVVQEFRETYRNSDVLIVENIHILSKKTTTQEELFHTFNSLHTKGKQLIFTSQYAPRNLKDIEERLVSRFEWGISLSLEKLSKEERLSLVEKRAAMLQFPLSKETLTALVDLFSTPNSLCKAIDSLVLRAHIEAGSLKKSSDITKEELEVLLKDFVEEENKRALTPEKLLSVVAKSYNVSTEEILGKSKIKELVLPRQVAMYLCRTELGLPYIRIGSIFSRDHSTVMSSVRLITKAISKQDEKVVLPLSDVRRLVASM